MMANNLVALYCGFQCTFIFQNYYISFTDKKKKKVIEQIVRHIQMCLIASVLTSNEV